MWQVSRVSSKPQALMIFSRSADLGEVKTRMRPLLTADEALSLHLALLQDTLEQTAAVAADRFLYLAGSGHLPFKPEIVIRRQNGSDLGARLNQAFEETLRDHDRVIAIGSDSPLLGANEISAAFHALDENDVVLGPSEDGGYYLIGIKFLIPELFKRISWGTEQVFQQSVNALRDFRLSVLPVSFDVDTPEDLRRLRSKLDLAGETPALHLRQWFRHYSER